MQFVTLEKDTKMSAVVTKSYKIEGTGSVAKRKRAEAALVQANPHLADLSVVPAGMVIVIPEVAGLARGAQSTPADEAVTALAAALRGALDELSEDALASAKRDLEAMAETQKLLKSRELKTLVARQAPHATDLLAALEADLKGQVVEGEQLLQALERGRAQLSADLTELEKRLA